LRALPNEDIYLYSKPIDNSRIVREPDATSRGGEWSMIGTACAVAVLAMGLYTPRVLGTFAGYQLESLKQEQQRLVDEQRDLNIEEARMSRQENLEALAKRRDMNAPTAKQIVHLDPKSDSKLALVRP
jgi:cell division protein FtsL